MASRILAGRYELLEKIGEGGMAVVFKAKDRLLSRFVAIKILRPEFTKDPVFIESFRRESQMAAGLTHPNIVNVYDVGKEGNIYYIVMELMEGKPLSDIIKEEGALEPQRSVNITRQIASALSSAHKNHLIHRDVKPHNIMFAPDGTAKITDFGIAKKVTGETLVSDQKENVMGSVHYFSPEQARGGYVDEKSDIYSLGICLFEMLTGKVPFDGETAVEVAVKHMNDPMPHPKDLDPSIPQDLDDIVMKATDKKPENRYKNMDEMITALNFVSYGRHHVPEVKEEKTPIVPDDSHLINREAVTEGNLSGTEEDDKEPIGLFYKNREKKSKASASESAAAGKTGGKKKFWLAPQRYIAVALAVLLAIPVSGGIHKLMTREKPVEIVEVLIPNVVGKSVDEATKELEALGLKLEIDLELVSKDIPEGQIMSQTPLPDSVAKSEQTVRVNVSKGYTAGTVPNVTGKSLSSAKTMLESYNYRLIVGSYAQDEAIAEGYIISQNPKSGTQLDTNGAVTVVVSSGAPEIKEFDIVGKTYQEAVEILAADEYTIGMRTNQSSSEIEEGCIIKYAINGKQVDVWVSTGLAGGGGGGKEQTETVIDGYISYYLDYSNISDAYTDEAFTVKITIVDSNPASRTINEICTVADGGKTLSIGGAGTDGSVTIYSPDNLIELVQLNHVDFQQGIYQ